MKYVRSSCLADVMNEVWGWRCFVWAVEMVDAVRVRV